MKWKKVSEHPLPFLKSSKNGYLFKEEYFIGEVKHTNYLKFDVISGNKDDRIVEWCEFNPDEIESSDESVKSKPEINLPSDLKENLKNVYGKMLDNDTKITDRILEAVNKRAAPSFEEVFRWEAAVRIFAQRNWSDRVEIDARMCVKFADALIFELKRGRE